MGHGTGPSDMGQGDRTQHRTSRHRSGPWTGRQDIRQGHRTCIMGHWAPAWAQPRKVRAMALASAFRAQAQWPMKQVLWPFPIPVALSYILWPCPLFDGPVLCPMPLSYVLWPCPMSHGPVARPMALCNVLLAPSFVLWPCPTPYGPVARPMALCNVPNPHETGR